MEKQDLRKLKKSNLIELLEEQTRLINEINSIVNKSDEGFFKILKLFKRRAKKENLREISKVTQQAKFLGCEDDDTVYSVALHYRKPDTCQSEYEIHYPSYRRAKIKASSMQVVAHNAITNIAPIGFDICMYGKHYVKWLSVGVNLSGESKVLFTAEVTSPSCGLDIWEQMQPEIGEGSLDITLND